MPTSSDKHARRLQPVPITRLPKGRFREIRDHLAARYPAAFGQDRRAMRPLAVNIHARIEADGPHPFSGAELRTFLAIYCTSFDYLEACVRAAERVDLEGRAVEAITDDHRQFARLRLDCARALAAQAQAERLTPAVSPSPIAPGGAAPLRRKTGRGAPALPGHGKPS